MEDQGIPFLLSFLYGEKVSMGRDEVSERLLRWCQAFDDWLAARKRDCHPLTFKNSRFAWKQLLSQVGKPPWKISPADMCSYVEWLQDKGRAPGTIRQHLGAISTFYTWCSERGVDPQCEPGFDPVKGVKRPKVRRYANAQVLNREEACALLAVLKLDDYILTKRDYAFFLARLRMGVAVKELLALQWRDIEE
ncbi:MAG TPA: phage integrase N-terminal SAM-like domain-containing protein, partial [Anaerolineales bacterium]